MAEDRPTAAFVLALIAAIFHVIGGILVSIGSAFVAFLIPALGIGLIAGAIVIIVLAILGVVWLYTGDEKQTTYGGVITLVVAVVAFPTLWGLILGSILGLIGGILGIVWKPSQAAMPAAAAAPPPPAPSPAPRAPPAAEAAEVSETEEEPE